MLGWHSPSFKSTDFLFYHTVSVHTWLATFKGEGWLSLASYIISISSKYVTPSRWTMQRVIKFWAQSHIRACPRATQQGCTKSQRQLFSRSNHREKSRRKAEEKKNGCLLLYINNSDFLCHFGNTLTYLFFLLDKSCLSFLSTYQYNQNNQIYTFLVN